MGKEKMKKYNTRQDEEDDNSTSLMNNQGDITIRL
jgi:hypothetical protein